MMKRTLASLFKTISFSGTTTLLVILCACFSLIARAQVPIPVITTSGPTTFCQGGAVTLSAPSGYSYLWNNGETTQSIVVTIAGAFKVTVSDGSGSATSAATYVTVKPLPLYGKVAAGNPNVNNSFFVGGFDIDNAGNIYVADRQNHRIQKFTPGATTGIIVAGGNGPGTALNQLNTPTDVAVDATGNLYITDGNNQRLVKWEPGASAGQIIASGQPEFFNPGGLDIDGSGNIYVANRGNNQVKKYAPGSNIGVTVAGGAASGSGSHQLNSPADVRVDQSGNLYILDGFNCRVQKWAPGASSGITVAGGNGQGTADNQIDYTDQITLDSYGNIYFVETNRVMKWVQGASTGMKIYAGANNYFSIATNSDDEIYFFSGSPLVARKLVSDRHITASGQPFVCNGSSLALYSPYATTFFNNLGYTYLWSNGSTNYYTTTSTPGQFYVDISGPNGCVVRSDTIVVQGTPPTPTITASGPTSFLPGGSVTLTAPAGYAYTWSTGASTQSIVVTNSGNYTVTVKNPGNCSSISAPVNVMVDQVPITSSGPLTFCNGKSVTLTAPAGYTSYSWINTYTGFHHGTTTQSINVSQFGRYSVRVYDGTTYKTSGVVEVNVTNGVAYPLTASGPLYFCSGGSVDLTAQEATSYQWYNGNSEIAGPAAKMRTFNATQTGSYRCQTVAADGCISFSSSSIVTKIEVSGEPVVCVRNENYNQGYSYLEVPFYKSFGTPYPPPLSYQWYANGVAIPGATGASYNAYQSGAYSVRATGPSGFVCNSTAFQTSKYHIPTLSSIVSNAVKTYEGENDGPYIYKYASCGPSTFQINADFYGEPHPTTPVTIDVSYNDGQNELIIGNSVTFAKSGTALVTLHGLGGCEESYIINFSLRSEMQFPETVLQAPEGPGLNQLWGLTDFKIDSLGNILVLDSYQAQIKNWSTDGNVAIVAGGTGVGGATTRLYSPNKFSVDQEGNMYIVEGSYHRIKKWAPGATSCVIVAGDNGPGSGANQLYYPQDVAVDKQGNIYIAEPYNNTIRKWIPGSSTGIVLVGGYGSTADKLSSPSRVIIDANDNLYVLDQGNNRVQKFAQGSTIGVTVANIDNPYEMAMDGSGSLFVLAGDVVEKFSPNSTSGIQVWSDPSATEFPTSLALDKNGDLYLGYSNGLKIDKVVPLIAYEERGLESPIDLSLRDSVKLIAPKGYTYLWSNGANSQSITVKQAGTYQLTVSNQYGCSVTDSVVVLGSSGSIPTITASGPTTFCQGDSVILTSSEGESYLWNTGATTRQITVKVSGDYYVSVASGEDYSPNSDSLEVVVIDPPRIDSIITNAVKVYETVGETSDYVYKSCGSTQFTFVTEFFGSPHPTDSVIVKVNYEDGGYEVFKNNTITLNKSAYVDIDIMSSSGCYFTNRIYFKILNLPIFPSEVLATEVPTIVGPFQGTLGIHVDKYGNIYKADYLNARIQKWIPGATSGVTVAGGNGWGSGANQINGFISVFVDQTGNVYVADQGNDRIQKWEPGALSGITVAGGNGSGTGANQLSGPSSVVVDKEGNIYIRDTENHRVQKWEPGAIAGITVASGIDLDSTRVTLPNSLTIDSLNNLYITDCAGDRVLKWVPGASSGITVAGGNGPGSAPNQLYRPRFVSVDKTGNVYVEDLYSVTKWPPGGTSGILMWKSGFYQDSSQGLYVDTANAIYINFPDRVEKLSRIISVVGRELTSPIEINQGDSVTLKALDNYSYLWSTGETAQTITVSTAGTYTATITNQLGCSATDSVTVIVKQIAVPLITASGPTSFCQGDSIVLTSSEAELYLWSTGATTRHITVKTSGSYYVSVSNGQGYSPNSAITNVTVNTIPDSTVTTSGPLTFCNGGFVTLTAASGPGYTYLWSNNETSQSINASITDDYTVRVTNASGCSAVSDTIKVKSLLAGVNGPYLVCERDTVQIWASPGFTTYQWKKDGVNIPDTAGTGMYLRITEGGNYTVTGNTPGGSCTSPILQVTKVKAPVLDSLTGNVIKVNDTQYKSCGPAVLNIRATYFAEAHPDTAIRYELTYDDGTSRVGQGDTLNLSQSAQVKLSLRSVACSSETNFHVNVQDVPPVPKITSGGPLAFCQGESVVLTAPEGYTYLWTNGATTRSITVSAAGEYGVTVTNENECSSSSDLLTVIINSTASNE